MKTSVKLGLIFLVIVSFSIGITQFCAIFFTDMPHKSLYALLGLTGFIVSHTINEELIRVSDEKELENEIF